MLNCKILYFFLCIVFIFIFTSSCSVLNKLEGDQQYLFNNKIEFNTNASTNRIKQVRQSLELLFKQRPQKKNVVNPRTWGKPGTVYDQKKTVETVEAMQQTLRNRKGFYKAKVYFSEEVVNRAVTVTYHINTGPQYIINSVRFTGNDENVLRILEENHEKTLLKDSTELDAVKFDNEKNRWIEILQNNGYANFSKNYIEYRGDSTSTGLVDIIVHVYAPQNADRHEKYTVGKVNVFTEHLAGEIEPIGKKISVDGVEYNSREDDFLVAAKELNHAITLRPGDVYQKSKEVNSYKKLTRLSPYRFTLIQKEVDPTYDSLLNYSIYLTPHNKKWIFDAGSNVFYTTINQSGNNLFGFNALLNLENRNFFRKGYRYSLNLEANFEFNIPKIGQLSLNSTNLELRNNIQIPRRTEPLGMLKLLKNLRIVPPNVYNKMDNETATQLSLGGGYNDIVDQYRLSSVSASWNYNSKLNDQTRLVINQLGFDFVRISIDSIFQTNVLDNNQLLAKAFSDQLFTGILLREFFIEHRFGGYRNPREWKFLANFEVSGWENYVINWLVNRFREGNNFWTLGGVGFAKFFKVESEIRRFLELNQNVILATRFNLGVVVPFGADPDIPGDGSVPFVKQFFVGGPNSMRAWRLRELGPGGYSEYLINPINNPFQAGDFKIDFSTELRFDLFWKLEGALFVDAGNVWLLKNDPDRPQSALSADFFKQIAVGSGWGIRLDFDYFIFRFDMGYKIKNPFPDPETGSYWAWKDNNSFLGNINFAINYPFN